MRLPAAAAALVVTGGLALATTSAAYASPAPSCAANPLGVAGGYAEFVEQNSTRYSDSEGAVAVGKDAFFGDGKTNQGFSIGAKLTSADFAKLPGGYAMVVGGTLHANQVVLAGPGVYGKLVDTSTSNFAVDGPAKQGKSPIDFAAAFTKLRMLSRAFAFEAVNGTVGKPQVAPGKPGKSLLFEGKDAKLNVFSVNAADLQDAPEIAIKVPTGSATVVNVLGKTYDMDANARTGVATYHVNIWDETAKAFVTDDYGVGSAAFKQVRSALLWNFPEATSVLKNGTSWPGTILAPNAKVEMGRQLSGGQIAPGHVNGSVIAKELVTIPGAETHQMNFTGCLPVPTGDKPGQPSQPEKPNQPGQPSQPPGGDKPLPPAQPCPPIETVMPPKPKEPPTPTGTPTGTPAASASSATPGTPADASPPLAETGASSNAPMIAAAALAIAVGAGATGYSVRRKRRTN